MRITVLHDDEKLEHIYCRKIEPAVLSETKGDMIVDDGERIVNMKDVMCIFDNNSIHELCSMVHEYFEREFNSAVNEDLTDLRAVRLVCTTDSAVPYKSIVVEADLLCYAFHYFYDDQLVKTEAAKDRTEFVEWLQCAMREDLCERCREWGVHDD